MPKRLYNIGLTDKRTHNKLIIRVWAESEEAATRSILGLLTIDHSPDRPEAEYIWRYTRPDTCFTET